MRARECDRCKQLYEYYDGDKQFKDNGDANALILIDRDMDNDHYQRDTYDLCPECMKKLMHFLNVGTAECNSLE